MIVPFETPMTLSHLIVAESVDLAHHDDAPVIARQGIERRLDPRRDLAPANDVRRIGTVDAAQKRKLQVHAFFGLEARFLEVRGLPAGLSYEIDAEVRDDAVQPGEEARPPLKAGQVLEDTKERVLDELPRVVLVPDQGERDGERATLVAFDELPKCPHVAGLRLRDKRTVFLRFPSPVPLLVGRPEGRTVFTGEGAGGCDEAAALPPVGLPSSAGRARRAEGFPGTVLR